MKKRGGGMFLFLFCMSILTPVSTVVVGMVMRKHPARDRNWVTGYRSSRSMKSQEAWNHAQKYCAGIWVKEGVAATVISAAVMLGCYRGDYETVSVGVIAVQLVCLCLSVIPVELELRKRF